MNITKKQQLVLDAINEYPNAANDDALLLAVVWTKEGWSDNLSLYDRLKRVTRPETLSRRRRELFNMGLIKYSPEALDKRTEAFKSEQNAHSDYEAMWNNMFKQSFEQLDKLTIRSK